MILSSAPNSRANFLVSQWELFYSGLPGRDRVMMGVDAAYQVHRVLGPELLKTVYEKILAYEIIKRQLNVEVQNPIPLVYDDMTFDECFRADMILEKRVSQPAGGLAVVGFCALREARMV